ncbi:TlpA family protein disulfide reductase [Micromonospora sp. NPDC007230]|uniref:TlpA family protein disulfide reductase n=1 Tax=Micromonospora sp. NPDC007230 TaxID=3364237 RepID=UPI0036D12DC0
MSVTTVAMTILALVCALNLLLLVGVIQRLREYESRSSDPRQPDLSLPVGARTGEFTAVSTTGVAISDRLLDRRTVVGVFSPTCTPCHRQLPAFIEYAGRADSAIAVVMTDGDDHTELAARLEESCPVVVEPQGGPITRALGVIGTPALLVLEDGVVVATETVVDRLPTAVRA